MTEPPDPRPGPVGSVEWLASPLPVEYPAAVEFMQRRADAVARGELPEAVWLLQHPALYTAGTSARDEELLDPHRFPVHRTGRGGRFTYHGPGQRVVYLMLSLRRTRGDVHAFVRVLEIWVIAALGALGIEATCQAGKTGVWTRCADGRLGKIGAIGIRVRRGVSFHGIAVNVDPDLSHFGGIVPCGLGSDPVTSIRALGCSAGMAELDEALRHCFAPAFASVPDSCAAP